MTDSRHAWLRVVSDGPGAAQTFAVSTESPGVLRWDSLGIDTAHTVAFGRRGSRRVTQRWQLGDDHQRVLRVAGRLDRPALAEITEVSPPAPTGAMTDLRADGNRLVIRAPALPAVATVDVSEGRWAIADGVAELIVGPGSRSFDVSVTLAPDDDAPADFSTTTDAPASLAQDGPRPAGIERLVARALAYVRSCTALAYGPDERAILTDHRLLPLSWTRDAYYQALLLLAGGDASDLDLVSDHLRWLWRRCERPDGRWMRSHHGNGAPKDLAFQADQQLYPFVELADLWRATGSLPARIDWQRVVPDAWRVVLEAVDPLTGLMATEENSADDRVDAPYVAASQVTLWYTAMRLAEPALASQIGLARDELLATAARVRAAFDQHLVIGGRWAYAADGRGRTVDYHDANDLPMALAPAWGFCSANDPAWRATMEFAFSPANPGFVGGQEGGLGSGHTPGAWPLGHIQAWVVGLALGEEPAAAAALDRLKRAAFADGMLPEAYVRAGAEMIPIRPWFAWPGAALGAFWLLDRRGAWDALAARQPGIS